MKQEKTRNIAYQGRSIPSILTTSICLWFAGLSASFGGGATSITSTAIQQYYPNIQKVGDFDFTKNHESPNTIVKLGGHDVHTSDLYWFGEEIAPRAAYYQQAVSRQGKYTHGEIDYANLEKVNKNWVNYGEYIQSALYSGSGHGTYKLHSIKYANQVNSGIKTYERIHAKGTYVNGEFAGLYAARATTTRKAFLNARVLPFYFDLARAKNKVATGLKIKNNLGYTGGNASGILTEFWGLTGNVTMTDIVLATKQKDQAVPISGHMHIENGGKAITKVYSYEVTDIQIIFLGSDTVSRTVWTVHDTRTGESYTYDVIPLGNSYTTYYKKSRTESVAQNTENQQKKPNKKRSKRGKRSKRQKRGAVAASKPASAPSPAIQSPVSSKQSSVVLADSPATQSQSMTMVAAMKYYPNIGTVGGFDFNKDHSSANTIVTLGGKQVHTSDLYWFSEEIAPRAAYYRQAVDKKPWSKRGDYTHAKVDYSNLEKVNKNWVNYGEYIQTALLDYSSSKHGSYKLHSIQYADGVDGGIESYERIHAQGTRINGEAVGTHTARLYTRKSFPHINLIPSLFDPLRSSARGTQGIRIDQSLEEHGGSAAGTLDGFHGMNGTVTLDDISLATVRGQGIPVSGYMHIENGGEAITSTSHYEITDIQVVFLGSDKIQRVVWTIRDAESDESYTYDIMPLGNSYTTYYKQARKAPETDPVTIADPAPEASQAIITTENSVMVLGTGTGTLEDGTTNDDIYETFTEVPRKGTSRLKHQWTFNVPASEGSAVFYLEAHHTANSEGDDFAFAYSTNGKKWTTMLTVTKTVDDDTAQFFVLPKGLSGTLHVRAIDTNRQKRKTNLDTLFVDAMFIVPNQP
jgi:hypothetical protein